MRRALAVLMALAAPLLLGFGYGPGTYGSAITSEFPHSGTLIITVDDGPDWVAQDLIDTLIVINQDSSLVGTPWALHASTFVNLRGANGIQGYDGEAGSANAMTVTELVDVHRSGLIEVGLHGMTAAIMDPAAWKTPRGVWAPWPWADLDSVDYFADGATGGPHSHSTQEMIVGGYRALVDTLGLSPIYSYVTNGHKMDNLGAGLIARYFRNCRSGTTLETAFSYFPGADATGATAHGSYYHLNRPNVDPMSYWWWDFDPYFQSAWTPFFPQNRLWLPHLKVPNNGGDGSANVAQTKVIFAGLAETKSYGILVWHRPNDHAGVQTLGGLSGLSDVLRFAAHYAANGALDRLHAPRLQILSMNEAMTKAQAARRNPGPLLMVDNFKMLPDHNSDVSGGAENDRPWGYPDHLVGGAWADSGWTYVDKDSCRAEDKGWFGYFNDTGILCTDVASDANFAGLVTVFPVVPGSRARVSCYATTSELPPFGAGDSMKASGCYVDIQFTPFGWTFDPTDSTADWYENDLLNDYGWTSPHETDPYNTKSVADWTGPTDSLTAYSRQRFVGSFHNKDEWVTFRSGGRLWGLADSWYKWADPADSTSLFNSELQDDASQRWRPFQQEFLVPEDTYWARITFQPTGWDNAGSDSLAVTGIEVLCTPR